MVSVVIRVCCVGSWWGLLQRDQVVRVGERAVGIVVGLLFGGGAERDVRVVMVRCGRCSRLPLWAALRTPLVRRGARKSFEASRFETMGSKLILLGTSLLPRLAAIAEWARARLASRLASVRFSSVNLV